jgi:hypothetical protein
MGCCLGALLLAGAPRLALLLWWWIDPSRVMGSFSWSTIIGSYTVPSWVWALLGFLLLPWTTVAFVFVAPGGVVGAEWLLIALGLLFDLGAHGGGGRAYSRRRAVA